MPPAHQVDVTQAVDPEVLERRRDHVDLRGLEGLFTLDQGPVEPGADPLIHEADGSRLRHTHTV